MKSLVQFINENQKNYSHTSVILEHIENETSITESFLRMGSDSWCELVCFYRDAYENGLYEPHSEDVFLLENLQTGKEAYYKDDGKWKKVKLDLPKLDPDKGDGKKYVVYRKKDGKEHEGLPVAFRIKFGSEGADLVIKNDDKGRVKSFWARHNCDAKTDKNTAGWWACYAPEKFGDVLNLRGGKSRW